MRFTTELSAARDSASRDQPGKGLKRAWQRSKFKQPDARKDKVQGSNRASGVKEVLEGN